MYTTLKTVHIACVVLSLGLFGLRLVWRYTAPAKLDKRWVRTFPHVIDSVLLASAIALTILIQQYPFVHPWLTAKVIALIGYIICGSLALKRARTRLGERIAGVVALCCAGYIVAVALTHDPLPFTL